MKKWEPKLQHFWLLDNFDDKKWGILTKITHFEDQNPTSFEQEDTEENTLESDTRFEYAKTTTVSKKKKIVMKKNTSQTA